MTNPTMHTNSLRTNTVKASAAAAAFFAGTVLTGSLASASEPTTEQLLEQIQALQAQVEKIEATNNADKASAKERMLADAETRGSFLQVGDDPDPFTAGHDGKFVLRSSDGNFELNPNFQLQIRHVANLAPDPTSGDDDAFDDLDFGFEIRRMKVGFKGHAFSPDLTYDFKFAFNRDGGAAVLENAFIDYTPETGIFGNEDLGFRIGQYKDPTFHEESTSSSKQLAADRSLVNETLGGGITDFVQGAGILYKGDKAKAYFAYVDGSGSANTNYEDPAATDVRAGFSGRVDIVVVGDDDSPFSDFTALGTDAESARIGFGGFLDLQDSDANDFQYNLLHTVDFQYETASGLGVFAAYYGQIFDTGTDDGYNAGALAQVSQVFDEDNGWEVFGRYNFIILDENVVGAGNEDFYHEINAGVNKYWESHNVKMTIDLGYLPNGNPGSNTGLGYRAAGGSEEGQLAIRGQFQLLL